LSIRRPYAEDSSAPARNPEKIASAGLLAFVRPAPVPSHPKRQWRSAGVVPITVAGPLRFHTGFPGAETRKQSIAIHYTSTLFPILKLPFFENNLKFPTCHLSRLPYAKEDSKIPIWFIFTPLILIYDYKVVSRKS
jgi:hypothetical protein